MPIKFEATADFNDLVRENQKAQRENAKLADQLRALTGLAEPMGAAGTRAFKDMARAADQAVKSLQTPADQFAAQVEKLDAAMKAKRLGAEEHAAAIDQLAATYSEAVGPVEQLRIRETQLDAQLKAGRISQDEHTAAMAKAQQAAMSTGSAVDRLELQLADLSRQHDRGELSAEEHAQAVLQLSQQFTAGAAPADRYERAVRELEQQHQRGEISAAEYRQEVSRHKQELDNATQSGEKQAGMFGTLGGKLLALGSGYMSFQAILGQVKAALDYVNRETERALESADAMTDPNRRLAQVATSAEDYSMMVRRADELAAAYGEDRDAVRRVSFSARSEGFEAALPEIIKYGDIVSAESAASVAGQVPTLFGGQINTMEAINATLAAAEASRLDFEQVAKNLPKVAEGGAIAGASPAETMAVLSVMSSNFASGETTADRIKSLLVKMGIDKEFGLSGKGGIGGVEALQALSEEDRRKFLGDSQELNVAYNLIAERLPEVIERTKMIESQIEAVRSGTGGILATKYANRFSEQTAEGRRDLALEERRQAIIAEEIANENQLTEKGAQREAAIAREKARQKDENISPIAQFGGSQAAAVARTLGLSPEAAAASARSGTEVASTVLSPQFWTQAGNQGPAMAIAGAFVDMVGRAREDREQPTSEPLAAIQPPRTEPPAVQTTVARPASVDNRQPTQAPAQQPPAQPPPTLDPGDNLRAIRAAMERTAAAVEDTRDVARTPRPGASAAAAAPSTQRMGR